MTKKRSLTLVVAVLFMFIVSTAAYAAAFTKASSTTYNGKRAVNYYSGKTLKAVYVGGSRSWRNNNPGNLRSGSSSIGTDYSSFAIFPDYNTGYAAMKSLITGKYKSYTIEKMIKSYAPSDDNNDPDKYVKFIVKQTGLSKTTVISKLSSAQVNSLLKAMIDMEGFSAGSIIKK